MGTHLALTAIGRERPGIVAAVTGVLMEHGANVEDSQMAILRGHFTMTLVVSLPAGADPEALRADLDEVAKRLELDALTLSTVATTEDAGARPSHIVTVYGADHPGIVHAAAKALADRRWSITDLNTRLVDDGNGDPLYVLMMEVDLGADPGSELEDALAAVRDEQGVEVTIRELDDDQL
jgi:glycine cleavage system transcriptional repressor